MNSPLNIIIDSLNRYDDERVDSTPMTRNPSIMASKMTDMVSVEPLKIKGTTLGGNKPSTYRQQVEE
jgi:hypothetical protein